MTKATDSGFELNDSIGLYLSMWKSDGTPDSLIPSRNYADNALFRLTALPDSWTPVQTLHYPTQGNKLDFYAYYPYRNSAFASGTIMNLNVYANQASLNNYTRSDFMTANVSGVKRSTAKVQLDFYHRLSQIVFVLKPGNGFTKEDLKSAKVKIMNAITDATYDITQKTDSFPVAGSTRQDITPCGSWVEKNGNLTGVMAILIPQQINTSTYIEVAIGSRKFTFKPTESVRLNPGCSREFTITLNNTGINIETVIHPWNICPPVVGDASEEDDAIVTMTTTKTDPSFTITKNDDITVDWGDGVVEVNVFSHTYADTVEHVIKFYGKDITLTSLNCNGNQLSKLDVTKNMALAGLRCSENQLSQLDVTQNTALSLIHCYNNQLSKLDVTQNTKITMLRCQDNQLSQLDVIKNSVLYNLVCNNNKLSQLDVTKNPKLNTLECENNQLLRLDVTQNTKLTGLYCSNNQLTEIDVTQNINLIELSCSNNQLFRLDMAQNTALEYLTCPGNPLISNNAALTALANTLVNRTGKRTGELSIQDTVQAALIQSICDTKNWAIE